MRRYNGGNIERFEVIRTKEGFKAGNNLKSGQKVSQVTKQFIFMAVGSGGMNMSGST